MKKKLFTLLVLTSLLSNSTIKAQSSNSERSNNISSFISDFKGGLVYSGINNYHIDSTANLLAFEYNNKYFTTGVDDSKVRTLTTRSRKTVVTSSWKSLEANNYDSINYIQNFIVSEGNKCNRPSFIINNNMTFRNEGEKGLNLNKVLCNIGNRNIVKYKISNINVNNINDDVPDLLINQVNLKPEYNNGNQDKLYFVDINGNRVGNIIILNYNRLNNLAKLSNKYYNNNTNNTNNTNYNNNYSLSYVKLHALKLNEFGINNNNCNNVYYLVHETTNITNNSFISINEESFDDGDPMPIFIDNFYCVKLNDNKNNISWDVLREIGGDKVELQHSNDGKNFNTIYIEGVATKTYNYIHLATEENNYYRLKLIDLDKTFTYSTIIKVTNKIHQEISFYPNPVYDLITFNQEVKDVKLHNLNGQVILKVTNVKTLDISNIDDGIYFLSIGDKIHKIIKK